MVLIIHIAVINMMVPIIHIAGNKHDGTDYTHDR